MSPKRRASALLLALWASPLPNGAAAADPAPSPPDAASSGHREVNYRIPGLDRRAYNYNAKSEIQGYAELVSDSYGSALSDAQTLKAAIDAFLAGPSDETLAQARDAWIGARRTWEKTEAFRFYDGPIDVSDTGPGPRERLDGWPVDPAAIDYVQDNPTAGIINNMKLAITRTTLRSQQALSGGVPPVTTGWHVIEFLLWGEQVSAGEPGDRPVTDFLPGQPNNDRRRSYLKLVTDLLIEDIRYLADSWDPKARSSYSAAFRLLNQRDALGRILNGAALLAGQELAATRLAGALDSKDRRLLTSHFSKSSYQDFVFALRGIRDVWTGDENGMTWPGLGALIARTDPAGAQRIAHALDHAEESIAMLRTPIDREILPAPPNSPARQQAERAIADLKRLASLIRDAGVKLGVAVYLPN